MLFPIHSSLVYCGPVNFVRFAKLVYVFRYALADIARTPDVEGRLEGVVDHVFDRYDKRYFLHEQVLVDDPSLPHPSYKQQYGAIVRRVLPPAHLLQKEVEDQASPIWAPVGTGTYGASELAALAAFPTAVEGAEQAPIPGILIGEHTFHPAQIDRIAHRDALNLDIQQQIADTTDPPIGYTYHVQLMQGTQFNGLIFEVDGTKLQRDRLMWNKALVKKYLKETLYRDPAVGSPWQVRPKWVEEYNVPTQVPAETLKRSADLRDDLLHRRKKVSRLAATLQKLDWTDPPCRERSTMQKHLQTVHLPFQEVSTSHITLQLCNANFP